MFQSLKKIAVAMLFSVAALLPSTAGAQVSKFAMNLQGKESYTITASLAVTPAPGQVGEFTGTIVPAGKLLPATDNFSGGFKILQGVAFTRLADDTIKIVDTKGNKFWVILKTNGSAVSASISDGVETLAKAEFSGVWYNDTGEAGAQSIPGVLASVVAQQAVAAEDPPKPTLNECLTSAIAACNGNGGLKTFKWSSAGICEFTCGGRTQQ
jgi:hypothetical protein